MGKIHAAKLDRSKRLQRVLALLRERGNRGATSMELITEAHVAAYGACVSELRENGFVIDCTKEGERYRYTLRENGQRELFRG